MIALVGLALAAPTRVAVVTSDDLQAYDEPTAAFTAEMASRGEPVRSYALHGRASTAADVVAELRRQPPDVVFCAGAKAAYAVVNGLPGVDVVFVAVLDPGRYGLKGSHVTGVTMDVEPVTFLSQMSALFPEVRTIGVLKGPELTDGRLLAMSAGSVQVDLELRISEVTEPSDVRSVALGLADGGVDALWVLPDREVLTASAARSLTDVARRRHLPVLVGTANLVHAGGTFTLVPDPRGLGRQAAELVSGLLAGGEPGRPVDPDALRVLVNLRAIEDGRIPYDAGTLDFVDEIIR